MNILVNGICGKMGRTLVQAAQDFDDVTICQGVDSQPSIDANANSICAMQAQPISFFSNIFFAKKCDVVIDFSSSQSIKNLLDFCLLHQIPVVIATTGHNQFEQNLIVQASKHIPILKCANMSLGANALLKCVENAYPLLRKWDVEIVEAHHAQKKDAPSGTAKMIFEQILACKQKLDEPLKNVPIHSLRGGGVLGNHEVVFFGEHEMLQIKHVVFSRMCFAKGALTAAKFLIDMPAGLYSMEHLLSKH